MDEHYFNTPYSLNMKLNRLKPHYLPDREVNKICKNLSSTIPILNNRFSYLKNKSKSLNKILNENKIAYNDTSFLNKKYYPSPNISQNFLYNNDNTSFSKNNISIYPNNKNDNLYPEQTVFTNYSYKNNNINNCNRLKNSKSTPFFDDINFNRFTFNNKDSLNYNYTDSNNFKNNFEPYRSFNNNYDNNYDNSYYSAKTQNLSNCIQQKDEVINELQTLIKKTMDKLTKKQEENDMLQNEITELKKSNSVCFSPCHFNCSCNCSCNCSSCYQQPLCSKYKKNCEYCKYIEEENKPFNFEYKRKNKFYEPKFDNNLNDVRNINYKVNNLINENDRNNHRFRSQIYTKKKIHIIINKRFHLIFILFLLILYLIKIIIFLVIINKNIILKFNEN